MRFRDTLLARILGGFLLNLLMVGLVLWGLYELRVGPASALAGLSGDRVRRATAPSRVDSGEGGESES